MLEIGVQSHVPRDRGHVSWLHWLFLNETTVLDKVYLSKLVWISKVHFQVEVTLYDGTIAVFPKSWQELGHVFKLHNGSVGMYLRNGVVVVGYLDFHPFFSQLRCWVLNSKDEL